MDFGKGFKFLKASEKNKKLQKVKKVGGNIFYSSINILKGGIPNEKDDLVSLIYLLLNLKFGFLPWSEFDKTNKDKYKKKVLESKENFDIDNFFGHNCQDLKDIYNVIFNLDPNEIFKSILFLKKY